MALENEATLMKLVVYGTRYKLIPIETYSENVKAYRML